jgi:hypothetical protein
MRPSIVVKAAKPQGLSVESGGVMSQLRAALKAAGLAGARPSGQLGNITRAPGVTGQISPKLLEDLRAAAEFRKLGLFLKSFNYTTDNLKPRVYAVGGVAIGPNGLTTLIPAFRVTPATGLLGSKFAGRGWRLHEWEMRPEDAFEEIHELDWPHVYGAVLAVGDFPKISELSSDSNFEYFSNFLTHLLHRTQARVLDALNPGVPDYGPYGNILGTFLGGRASDSGSGMATLIQELLNDVKTHDGLVNGIDCIPFMLSLGSPLKSYYDTVGLTAGPGAKASEGGCEVAINIPDQFTARFDLRAYP